MKVIEKSFKYWEVSELQDFFGLVWIKELAILNDWLTTNIELTQEEITFLKDLLKYVEPFLPYWNETELRENFIIDLTKKVRFSSYEQNIAAFSERGLKAVVQNEVVEASLHGVVDWMIAKGIQRPKQPFFFIHEYKAEDGKVLDGRGQLLATMLVAQELNKQPPEPTFFNPTPKHFYKDIPIYGAYISGRNWFFVVLENNKYNISQPFVATKIDDLQAIFKILKAQKQLIYSYLES